MIQFFTANKNVGEQLTQADLPTENITHKSFSFHPNYAAASESKSIIPKAIECPLVFIGNREKKIVREKYKTRNKSIETKYIEKLCTAIAQMNNACKCNNLR